MARRSVLRLAILVAAATTALQHFVFTMPWATRIPLQSRSARNGRVVACSAEGSQTVAKGLVIAVDFKLNRVDNGQMVDSTEGRGPLEFTCGSGQVLPVMEAEVDGMAVGESKDITLEGTEFGERDDDKIVVFPAERIPPNAVPGQELQMEGPSGVMRATVLERNETSAMLDFNHPFAGMPLSMTVTVVSIKEPPDESSIVVETISPGDAATYPKPGDNLVMHYTGTLSATGEKFDSSVDRGEPFSFQIGVGMVIPGWDVGVMKMSLGEKAVLRIPSEFGYGQRGAGGVIPPNADLVFEVELLKINA